MAGNLINPDLEIRDRQEDRDSSIKLEIHYLCRLHHPAPSPNTWQCAVMGRDQNTQQTDQFRKGRRQPQCSRDSEHCWANFALHPGVSV